MQKEIQRLSFSVTTITSSGCSGRCGIPDNVLGWLHISWRIPIIEASESPAVYGFRTLETCDVNTNNNNNYYYCCCC